MILPDDLYQFTIEIKNNKIKSVVTSPAVTDQQVADIFYTLHLLMETKLKEPTVMNEINEILNEQ